MKRTLLPVLAVLVLLCTIFATASAAEITYPTLEMDSMTTVSIDTAGETVSYQFVPSHSCRFAFHAVSDEDTYGELYDSEGNLLYENDDYYGLNFGIECTLEAGRTYILTVCLLDTAATGSFELLTATDHDVLSELTKAGNCTADGLWTHKCNICGYSWTETIPADHQYENGVCTECGAGLVLDGVCGESLSWHYDGITATLTITGSGAMYDYDEDTPPWYELIDAVSCVKIDSGATYVGKYAFSGMEAITSVTLPNTVTAIGDSAFSYCGNLRSIDLPEGLTTIGAAAFSYGHLLSEVSIPAAVTQIGAGAFRGCGRLTQIRVSEDNAYYAADDFGVLFDKDMQYLIQAPAAMRGSYCVPDTVCVIGDAAFGGCDRLLALTIPESVTQIGSDALAGCSALTFLRIPAAVTNIGDTAFGGCTSLKAILFEGNPPTVDGAIFENVTADAYYPAEDTAWTEDVRNLYGSGVTWVGVSDFTILVQPEIREELVGNTITLVVGVNGSNPTYTWWVEAAGSNDFVQSDCQDSVYSAVLTEETVGQQIYCVITDDTGATVRSDTVTLRKMTVLEEGMSYTVNFDTSNDFRYFAFTPQYSCYYTFRSLGNLDTYCELYNAQYDFLAASDDGYDVNFNLKTLLEAEKTYILGVRIYGDGLGSINVMLENSHSFDTNTIPPTCTVDGYTTYVCTVCAHSYGVAGERATGHSYSNGACVTCGVKESSSVVVPNITLAYPSLNFESEIMYNIYYSVDSMADVVDMGLITFDSFLTNGTVQDATEIISGYVVSNDKYMSHTNGIPAKMLGDALYFRVYAKLSDGTYVYSQAAGYHAVAYAKDMLETSTNPRMKSLVVAMLNYGAAAQKYFNYRTDALMNSFLTEQQQALADEYRADMVGGLTAVDLNKVGKFTSVGGYRYAYPKVSFEGEFAINIYLAPAHAVNGNMTLYYWKSEDYHSAEVLTAANATGTVTMQETGSTGEWMGVISGIAAKEIDQTVYFAGVYESEGVTYCSGVISYSLGTYCQDRIANGSDTMKAFAAQTAVYGYYAKAYFADL